MRSDSSKPCASFNKAFAIAQSGDVVQVAAGDYGSQSISQSSKTSAVTVRPASGATVTVASLSVNASHFHIEGIVASGSGQTRGDLNICGSECNPGLVDVLIKDGGFRSAFIRASGVTVQGGDYGGFDACNSNAPEDGFRFWGGSVVAQPTNDVLDGVTIHDITSGSQNTCQGTAHAGYHVDCMQNQGGQNITIRNSTFYNCPTSDIQMEPFSGATIGNVTIENNFFGPTACCNSVVLGTTASGANCSSLVIRYNVLYNTPNPDVCASGSSGVQVYGNIFPSLRLLLERRLRPQRLRRLRRLDVRHRSQTMHTGLGLHTADEHRWGQAEPPPARRRTPARTAPVTAVATRPPTSMVNRVRRARRLPTRERTRSASSRESESVVTARLPRPRPHRRLV